MEVHCTCITGWQSVETRTMHNVNGNVSHIHSYICSSGIANAMLFILPRDFEMSLDMSHDDRQHQSFWCYIHAISLRLLKCVIHLSHYYYICVHDATKTILPSAFPSRSNFHGCMPMKCIYITAIGNMATAVTLINYTDHLVSAL